MTPIYFGSSARRLFGLYENAQMSIGRARAVLFCHAAGSEYLESYRAIRFAAGRFAASGYSSLRFDYYGSGDSEGESVEAELPGWQADIETAMNELKELAQVRSVALFGLRLGATLAAEVAERVPHAVTRLILWEPIVDGANYIKNIEAKARLRMGRMKSNPSATADNQFDGLRASPSFLSALRAIDRCPSPRELVARTLMVRSAAEPTPAEPAAAQSAILTPEGGAEIVSFDRQPWVNDPGGALPLSTIEQVIQWMR